MFCYIYGWYSASFTGLGCIILNYYVLCVIFYKHQILNIKISKGFAQKLASFGLKTPFKDQMGSQKTYSKGNWEAKWQQMRHCSILIKD